MTMAGDLARRISERRTALRLGIEDVASRAGMDPSYLASLESSPSPQLTRSALLRLAAALETTIDALEGARVLSPAGQYTPTSKLPSFGTLEPGGCRTLIAKGGIGRVVVWSKRGPIALPVNFATSQDDIVFRTSADSELVHALTGGPISFEVDHIDDALTEGWSVLISGHAQVITDPDELASAQGLGIHPWASGARDVYVRLTPTQTTGRTIRGT